MEPGIELWDLDVLDAVEPVACLGGQAKAAADGMDVDDAPQPTSASKKKKKKKKRAPALIDSSHTDAVLGLAWNREFRNVLASASADTTVKVWDIATQQCQHTLEHHRDKVQALQWNPTQHATLLSGGFDRQAAVVDMRTPDGSPMVVPVSADVEAVAWGPGMQFLVSTEDGMVALFDARVGGKKGRVPVWRLQAHDKAACAVGVCPAAPHVMVTASVDKKVRGLTMCFRIITIVKPFGNCMQLKQSIETTMHIRIARDGNIKIVYQSLHCQISFFVLPCAWSYRLHHSVHAR